MRLLLLTEDLQQTIKILKSKYPDQPVFKISEKVQEQAIEWIAKSLSLDSGIWDEDLPRFLKEYENYFKSRNNQRYVSELKKIHFEYRNILNYTLHDLETASENINPQVQWSQGFRELPDGAELFREASPYRMIKITTPEAAVELSKGTKWCTSNQKTAKHYLEQGPLYVIYKNNQKIAQYYESKKSQLMDLRDKPYHNAIKIIELFDMPLNKSIAKNPWSAYWYTHDIIKKPWPEVEPVIMKSPEWAYQYALNVIKKRWPEAELVILKNPEWAYKYALNVIKGPWPEAEPIILKSPLWASWYACYVTKSKWLKAEPTIMKNPESAFWYARDVIKDRWLKAEPTIMKDPESACRYALDIIKSRWPEAEPIIMKDPKKAYQYAIRFLDGQWLEAEKYIKNSKIWWEAYQNFKQ